MFDNKNLYPTPDSLIDRMLDKISGSPLFAIKGGGIGIEFKRAA